MTPTDRERLAGLGFYAVALLLAWLVYQLFQPFLVPLAWAAVLAICCYPAQRFFERRACRSVAALVSTLCVALLIIGPILIVASAFVSEAADLLRGAPRFLARMPEFARQWLQTAFRYVPGGDALDPPVVLADLAKQVAAFASTLAARFLQGVVVFVVNLVITLFALFFLFRDGPALVSVIRRVIPFEAHVSERLIEQTTAMVNASVSSSLVVAAVQGMLGGVTFWLLGVGAPLFWGVLIGVCCLLPFGAWVIWAPAAIWLVASGSVVRGIVLAALGAGVVSSVDNVLRPVLLSSRSEMNGLLMFISLLGGVVAFGTLGLVAGPVLMAAAIALLDAFTSRAIVHMAAREAETPGWSSGRDH